MRHQWNTHDATQNVKILKVHQFTHWSNICIQTCTYVTSKTKAFKISLLNCTQNSRISHHLPCTINKKLFGGGGVRKWRKLKIHEQYMLRYLLHIMKYVFAPSNILTSFYCYFLILIFFFNALKDTRIIVNLRPTWHNLVKIKEMSLVTWRNKPLLKKLKEL